MRRVVIGILFIPALIVLPGLRPAAARSALRIHVSPHVATAPTTLHLDLWIDPSAADRSLKVTADSGAYERSSGWTLDGTRSRRLFTVDWPGLPAGYYTVRAELDLEGHRKVEVLDYARLIQR